jgi:predicted flap endonuclease-1-like 5' DNA nuclease
MANYGIEDIEGIGSVFGEKLRAVGITDTDGLLAGTRTRLQRMTLAEKSGLPETKILKFANMADLYRISGIGSEYSELLEAAGVDTVPELAQRNPANLAQKIAEVNEAKKLTRRVPSEKEIASWVEQAKSLPRVLEY